MIIDVSNTSFALIRHFRFQKNISHSTARLLRSIKTPHTNKTKGYQMAKTSTDPHLQHRTAPNHSTRYWRIQLCALMFSMGTILPTTAWADSFSINIGPLCSFCFSGTLHVDHTIADGFFFSGPQDVTTISTIGDPVFDGTLIYHISNIPGAAPTIFSLSNTSSDPLPPTLSGTLDFEIGKNGNPNEITFSETRSGRESEEEVMETQMGSFIFTHEGTTPIPEPNSILLFLTGLIGLIGYWWRNNDMSWRK